MEIFSKSGVLNVVSNSKAIVSFDINSKEVKINDLEVSFP
jgi:hypothetical protein